jgi:hypothetical protein
MRFPTHLIDFQTVLSPSVDLTNKLLDLSGATYSVSDVPYDGSSDIQLPAGSIQVSSVIHVDENASTQMKKADETFYFDSAVIRNVNLATDLSGGTVLGLLNKYIDFVNPRIAVPLPSVIATTDGKIRGIINTYATYDSGTNRLSFTNAYIQLMEQRISIQGGQAIPDLSGVTGPAMVSDSDESLYISFISRYRNNINYSNTMYDILVGRIKPSWTLEWLHRIQGLVTTHEETTPVITIGSDHELYLAYTTTGATSGNVNGFDIYQTTGTSGICGCPDPTSCTLCGTEDIVFARINTIGASSSNPPTVAWKIQNGYINSVYRETKPTIALDKRTSLVYLAYECTSNLACFRSVGSPNILLHCFTTQGNHLWIQSESAINSTGANTSPSISADNDGNVYLAYEITAQVEGGAPVPVGEKQIEVVRFQTVLQTPSESNTYNPSRTYNFGDWVYYPPTSSWYKSKEWTLTNDPPPSPKWSEAYSARLFYYRRVWILSETVDIFTKGGIAGDNSSFPSIVAHPSNGYVFLSFLTSGTVINPPYEPSPSVHTVVLLSFTKDRMIRWIQEGGPIFQSDDIAYTDCTTPQLIMDSYGNLVVSLVTTVPV